MLRVDLHTHSIASVDGGLTEKDYESVFKTGKLDVIAITDHNRIDFAQKLHEKFHDAIIVGEEISTPEGDIIGLYLVDVIHAGRAIEETIDNIHQQGGIVYIPHPFETVRKGLTLETLNRISDTVDIIEIYNGRTLQNRGEKAQSWAREHGVPSASSSDAHGSIGWGRTVSLIEKPPTKETLVKLLENAEFDSRSTGIAGRLYPKLNRMRNRGMHA